MATASNGNGGKARHPAMPAERYGTMLVQVCGQRVQFQELLEEIRKRTWFNRAWPRWEGLEKQFEATLAELAETERKLAKAAQRDYPDRKLLPPICVNR